MKAEETDRLGDVKNMMAKKVNIIISRVAMPSKAKITIHN